MVRDQTIGLGFSFPYSHVFSQYRLCSSCPAVKQVAAFHEAQVCRLQHGQEGSAGEEAFASPPDAAVGMSPTHGGEGRSLFPSEGCLVLAADS